jgi:uncharacterized protein YfaA (DUF2138 family)
MNVQELEYPRDNPEVHDLSRRLEKARARVAALEDLVSELLVVYYHQDDDRISALRKELDI